LVVVLPHAHVSPDEALACLRFDTARTTTATTPTISVMQLSCCAFVWHATALGLPPHVGFLDPRITSAARANLETSGRMSRHAFSRSAKRHETGWWDVRASSS
jgi:hypothetical protein